jgi:hypothetical protein
MLHPVQQGATRAAEMHVELITVGGTVTTKHWPWNYLAPVASLCVLNQGWCSEHSGHQDSGYKIL